MTVWRLRGGGHIRTGQPEERMSYAFVGKAEYDLFLLVVYSYFDCKLGIWW